MRLGHTTTWEDGRCAGFRCGDDDAGIIGAEDDGWTTCPNCGHQLKLHWDVWIEEYLGKPEETRE